MTLSMPAIEHVISTISNVTRQCTLMVAVLSPAGRLVAPAFERKSSAILRYVIRLRLQPWWIQVPITNMSFALASTCNNTHSHNSSSAYLMSYLTVWKPHHRPTKKPP